MGWIKKVAPRHRCEDYLPRPDGMTVEGSIWECDCGHRFEVLNERNAIYKWKRLGNQFEDREQDR
jgi:hypothetical protein